ncbi:protein transport protein Sec24C-like isoform X2 [Mizuhopecten yessoensis]|uniref:Protein transport protein Sec24C n=1 Tax=Mizuhopecten yessoensis TaxID=6573 RepID=A0A210QA65_MIZYE|nr:protein transport protein Sec24C-like isoform X2 [Mizuhopecten yessoensis]OWF45631.1 Protein transport protein Sec24C [Mizuhopecten yessoensis]
MNPQFPGNQGQMPPTGYGAPPVGGQRPPMAGQPMYNGTGQQGQSSGFPGGPPKPMGPGQSQYRPMSNGPQPGGFPGGGPQGDNIQYGAPRAPAPAMVAKPVPPQNTPNSTGPPNSMMGPGPAPNIMGHGQPPNSMMGQGAPPHMMGPGGRPPAPHAMMGSPNMMGQGAQQGGQFRPPTPGQGQFPGGLPPSSTQQMTNQMGGMTVSDQPRTMDMSGSRGGPPSTVGNVQGNAPPTNYGQYAQGGPPSGPPIGYGGGAPPKPQTSTPASFPHAPGPATSVPGGGFPNQGPPTSMPGGFPNQGPSTSMPGGFPNQGPSTSTPGGFPNQGPPSSMPGGFPNQGPPTSMSGGFPNQGPPTSMPGGFPPPGPPSSQYGGMPPMSSQQMPPSSPGPHSLAQPGPPGRGQQYMGGTMPGTTFPPQTGYQSAGGQHMPAAGGIQQPAPRKLDPDQMPSPIQVIEDDEANKGGVFSTLERGAAPPLVTTPFTVQDQGNCNPRFMRSTTYTIPCTADLLKTSHIPLALTISPFAKLNDGESAPPIVNLGEVGPVRCKRCKAYMNPFMMFIDGGRRFQCVFCGAQTDVPAEYFQHLDHTGRRVDAYDRPELCLGSYEFVATKDYCKNSTLPNAPAFIFMIDVSYNSVKSGLVHLLCKTLKEEILVNLPKEVGAEESEIRVGFVTYAKEIHFYNVKGNLAQPQMLVVSDLDDVFVPLLDGFLVKLSESEAVIDSLLAQIPVMFAESRETETVLGPVIQAGLDALKSADRSGKLYIFHSSLPIAEAPGKLKNRDDRKLLGTDKEKTILTPQNNFYTKVGQECVVAGCSVDMFLFPNAYIDVASISDVCRLTGGSMYKYSYFQADLDGSRFMEDLKMNVESQAAFDAILRVRTSTGIRPVDFYGNFYMANTTDVELAAMSQGQAIGVEVKHDDKLNEGDGAFVQIAVLFTSVSGQRRLRIHNLSFNCCMQMADLFRSCELDTLVNFMSKQAVRETLNSNPRQVRENVMNQVAQILACYRKSCASPSSAGQLILPECMKLLPLYSNCIIKSDGLQGGSEISTDDRSYLMHLISAMDVKSSHVFFYPRLMPLHNLEKSAAKMPRSIRCSAERLQDNGVYLLENGISMFMWIGHNVDPHWIQDIFSVQSAAQVDIDKCKLLALDNPLSQRVNEVIQQVREERHRYMKLTIVRQRDKLEPWFNHFLVEDKGLNNSASYVDYLCHIHKEIRGLLS